MPAYFDTGFCVRQPSWHQQELLLPEYPENWDDARMAAGLMWEPRLVPLYRKTLVPRPATDADRKTDPTAVYQRGDEWMIDDTVYVETSAQAVERDDTGDELGVVSDSFELLTHAEMGPILEAILGDANAKFETAGSVKGGRMVWALVRLDEPEQAGPDVDEFGDAVMSYPYLTLLNSHDGTGACKVVFTTVRVVCWNTIQAADAEGERSKAQFVFRHTSGMHDRIDEAKQALAASRADFMRWRETAEQLSLIQVTPEMRSAFLADFIPEPVGDVVSDRVRANIARDRDRFVAVCDSVTNAKLMGTGLGLVNAAVEYLDHVRGYQTAQTYMGRQLLRPEPLKAKAVALVRELANV